MDTTAEKTLRHQLEAARDALDRALAVLGQVEEANQVEPEETTTTTSSSTPPTGTFTDADKQWLEDEARKVDIWQWFAQAADDDQTADDSHASAKCPQRGRQGPKPRKLDLRDARLIRAALHRLGDSLEVRQGIAAQFGIRERHIRRIRDGHRWPEPRT